MNKSAEASVRTYIKALRNGNRAAARARAEDLIDSGHRVEIIYNTPSRLDPLGIIVDKIIFWAFRPSSVVALCRHKRFDDPALLHPVFPLCCLVRALERMDKYETVYTCASGGRIPKKPA